MNIDLSLFERSLIRKALIAYLVDCYSQYFILKECNPSLASKFHFNEILSVERLLELFK